jgi:hypothetical protein
MPTAIATRTSTCRWCRRCRRRRFKPGRYVKAKEQPLTNLFLSMADAMGSGRIESHGDSTGRFA